MKIDTISSEYRPSFEGIRASQINKDQVNRQLQDKIAIPQDRVDAFEELRHIIHSTSNRSVELSYSIPLKTVSASIIEIDGRKIKIKDENLPKELRLIESPEVFGSYVKNTYAKVSTLSDGEYSIGINHKLLGGGYESGSITPTTQGKAMFDFSEVANSLNKQETRKEEAESVFKDIKILQDNETFVTINNTNDRILNARLNLKELQQISEDNVVFVIEYQKSIAQPYMMQQNDCPLVKRFGINPETVKGATGYGIAGDKLHYVEKKIFDTAFEELNLQTSAEASKNQMQMQNSGYLNNVVLVDIFERVNGIITGDENSIPKTHTVVLWKKTDKEIVLIDPSKQNFSSFLKNVLSDEKIKIELPNLPSKDGILYGINYNDYSNKLIKKRDCIDIAVKIGFELNELQKELSDINIIQSSAIKQLTNDFNNNDALNSVKKLILPFEDLQSSDRERRLYTSEAIKNYTKLKEDIALNKNSKEKTISEKFKSFDQIVGLFEKDIKSFEGLEKFTTSVDIIKTINNY
ncbi:hypothetical protein Trichorick_01664 (plasmid) [Candidatus Trichorickettsia mobilis]|uniref:hypothetical protein n=1 Tax=Candidatus Trichorickettsia mobilis TaxID=1346319 RepID=UPI002B25C683|nr:hypothetical protein [Candidatus Trichorickettsia mobilis]WPY01746.1 hypothetical protein Trichorick_01664 [Candidatus Trichorickettsia mobilis]